jgi:oligopeptide/dipeptide ABC transporter ATP-binding protein
VGLLGSIPVLGRQAVRGRLRTIPGMVPSLLRLPEGCLFSDRCPDVFDDCRKVAPAMVAAGENHLVRCLKYV